MEYTKQINIRNYRKKDLIRKLSGIYEPLDVMLAGATGAGKSSTVNALFRCGMTKAGDGPDPETKEISHYMLNPYIRLWDTPGLGDGTADKAYIRNIGLTLDMCYTLEDEPTDYKVIDMVLVIMEGSVRDMGTTYKLLTDVIIPKIAPERIVIGINQSDIAMKGQHWDSIHNRPDSILYSFLEEKSASIRSRIFESTGIKTIKPVFYSAEHGWNIEALMDMIIDNVPGRRRR